MRKRLVYLTILTAIILSITVPVFAYSYSAQMSVSESSGNAYTNYPLSLSLDNAYLASNGYMLASGLDQQINYSGTQLQSMAATDRTMFVTPSSTLQSNTILPVLSLGNTASAYMPIVLGNGGYITTSYNAALEPVTGNNIFSFEYKRYIDITKSNIDIRKDYSMVVQNSTTTLSCAVVATPISEDGNTLFRHLHAYYQSYATQIGTKIVNFSPNTVSSCTIGLSKTGSPTGTGYLRVRDSAGNLLATIGQIDVSSLTGVCAYYTFTGTPYVNTTTQDLLFSFEYGGGVFPNFVSVYYTGGSAYSRFWYDGSYHVDPGYSAVKVTCGTAKTLSTTLSQSKEYTVRVYSTDGTTLRLNLDGVDVDSGSGFSVPNIATTNWLFTPFPYFRYLTESINNVEVLRYQPITVVTSSVMPNIDSGSYNGAITWGSNPSGITTEIGALASSNNITVNVATTAAQGDLVNLTGNSSDLNVEDANQPNNIFTPWFNPWANLSNIPVLAFFLIIGTIFLLVAVVWTMKHTQNQFIGSVVLILGESFLWKLGIYQLWFVIVTFLICLAIIIFERKPAL